jgi:hypothetical protein
MRVRQRGSRWGAEVFAQALTAAYTKVQLLQAMPTAHVTIEVDGAGGVSGAVFYRVEKVLTGLRSPEHAAQRVGGGSAFSSNDVCGGPHLPGQVLARLSFGSLAHFFFGLADCGT